MSFHRNLLGIKHSPREEKVQDKKKSPVVVLTPAEELRRDEIEDTQRALLVSYQEAQQRLEPPWRAYAQLVPREETASSGSAATSGPRLVPRRYVQSDVQPSMAETVLSERFREKSSSDEEEEEVKGGQKSDAKIWARMY